MRKRNFQTEQDSLKEALENAVALQENISAVFTSVKDTGSKMKQETEMLTRSLLDVKHWITKLQSHSVEDEMKESVPKDLQVDEEDEHAYGFGDLH